jgi:replicative DNA helicase
MRKNSLSFADAMRELSRLAGLEEEYRDLCRRYAEMNNPDRYNTPGGGVSSQAVQADRKDPLQATPEANPEEKYREFLEVPDIQKEVSRKKEGIKTGYTFKTSQGKEERLILSPGLTLICGKSSHGKSRFLQNLALQILEDLQIKREEGEVLFFAFEEDYPEVLLQFANLYAKTPGLSQYGTKNTEVLRDYFIHKEEEGWKPRSPEDIWKNVCPRLERFTEIQKSGKLRIYYSPDLQIKGDRTPLEAPDLSGVISYLSSQRPIKAVFLDYVQAIYKDGYRKDRREELREICKELNDLSKRLDIPFILSAQLNRETPNPTSMSGDNIAESADITRYGDTILCLWNSAFLRDVKNKETYLESQENKTLQSRGFTLGEEGKLYCYLTKNRGGTPFVDAVLDYYGETGEIPTNEDLPPDTAPQTGRQPEISFSGDYEEA